MRRALLVTALLLGFGTSHAVRADDISPPPSDCAPGTTPHSSHVGEWCEDTSCASDAQCGADHVCREVAACVDTPGQPATGPSTVDSPRGSSAGPGRPVYGTCFDGHCARGTCERAKRCVSRDVAGSLPVAAPGGPSSGGASAGGPSAGGATQQTPSSPASAGARSRGCACIAGGAPLRTGAAFALSSAALLAFVLVRRRRR